MKTSAARPALARMYRYWLLQLGGWSGTAVLNTLFSANGQAAPRLTLIWWWGALSGLALSELWRRHLKRHGWVHGRMAWKKLASAIIALGAGQTGSVALAFVILMPAGTVHGLAWLPAPLMFWSCIFLLWTMLYSMTIAARRAAHLEAEALRLQILAKDAELRALQAQINPHFFFNSLNSLRALIFEDRLAAAGMLDQIAELMRYALQSGRAETVPLAAEMAAVEAYLAIEQIRFEERLRVAIRIDADCAGAPIPPMALQTLVENAVKYGVENSPGGGDIRITARREGAVTRIVIANSGALAGLANSTRIGLDNTRKRLALSLGGGLELAEGDGWVVATLTLPAA